MASRRLPGGRQDEALALLRDVYRRGTTAVRRTPGLLALSFLLGAALWVFVTDTENPTIVDAFPAPIPVEAVNVDPSLAVANQLSPIEVRVSAATDRWEELAATNFRAYVDLNGLEARSQEVPVRVEVTGTSGVRVVDTNPRVITVNLEQLLTNEVPVSIRVVGQLPIGYELGVATPETQNVTVHGPASLVALVSEGVADVNVTGLTAGVETNVTLRPQGAGGGEIRGVRLEPPAASVSVQVIQSTIVRTVPLTVEVSGTPDRGYQVTGVSTAPVTVQVQGPVEALQQIDQITLPPFNVAGARSDIARSIEIPLPPEVSLLGGQRATVTVNVSPVDGTQRTTLAVELQNVAGGQNAEVTDGSVEVVLHGPMPTLTSLLPGDVRATVDLEGLGPDTFTLPVEVVVPQGVAVESVQPETVTVTISES